MIVSNDFIIESDYCGREHTISPDTLDVDYAYDERGMGTEIQHIFYDETDCRCREVLRYKITAVEYPVGAYNFHESESENCSFNCVTGGDGPSTRTCHVGFRADPV